MVYSVVFVVVVVVVAFKAKESISLSISDEKIFLLFFILGTDAP